MTTAAALPTPDPTLPPTPAPAPTPTPTGPEPPPLDLGRIAQDLQIRKAQVEAVVHLLDEGNTVPFITRYRKERTGGLNEEVIRIIQKRVQVQRELAARKQTILKSIQGQGKLTDDLQKAILHADSTKRLEDLYLPFKPKKKTLASAAREKGLEPLALAVWNRDPLVTNLADNAQTLVNPEKGLATPEEVLAGVQHILAEMIAETADVRDVARRVLWDTGKLNVTKAETVAGGQGLEYKDYFQFSEPVRQLPPHRVLAVNRGEKENILKVKLEFPQDQLEQAVLGKLPLADHPHAEFLKTCALDALNRLLLPSLEREIRRDLTDRAEDHAVSVFSRNLRRLLLQPPVRGQRLLAIDPGLRTGCKVVALDEIGNVLEDGLFYLPGTGPKPERKERRERGPRQQQPPQPPAEAAKPPEVPAAEAAVAAPPPAADAPAGEAPVATAPPPPAEPLAASPPAEAPLASAPPAETPAAPPAAEAPAPAEPPAPPAPQVSRKDEAKNILGGLITKHHLNAIAIGNGTGCREAEELVAELIQERFPDLAYVIVNEAGASHYSASGVGREEFPNLDATVRGTISIGRRLQDPLSELVKIDPQNIGVGLYQHDLSEKRLKESLDGVIESCVNHVGVDLNTASVPLLRHVSGLNQLSARNLVEYRRQHGPFKNRDQLKEVPGVGPATYTQAAGFLKINEGENPLDATWIHPESYPATVKLLEMMDFQPTALREPAKVEELREKLKVVAPEEVARHLDVGVPTFEDIAEALSRPGRDPREDLPKPIFKKGVLKLEDLQPGMELKGTVLNVVDFGAFVDVGLKDSGLVHISQLANRFVKSPYDVVAVGDVVTVWVLSVDQERRRVSLTMIPPGTERKPPERRPAPAHQERGDRGGERRPPVGQPQGQGQGQGGPGGPGGGGGRFGGPRRFGQGGPPQGQGGGGPRRFGGPGQGGGRPGGGPRRFGAPPPAGVGEGGGQGGHGGPPPRPAPPPRPPRRDKPPAKLTDDAKQGKAPLRTFGELKAFFEHKKTQDDPPAPPAAEQPAPPPAPDGAPAEPHRPEEPKADGTA